MRSLKLFHAAGLALALLLVLVAAVAASVSAPQPGTVARAVSYTFIPETVLDGSATAYSETPRVVSGEDVSRITPWHSADVFVTGDVTPTHRMTVTAQLSVDGVNWADAIYYLADSDGDPVAQTYALYFTGDGTQYMRIPLAGERLRFRIEKTSTVTSMIQVTLRND